LAALVPWLVGGVSITTTSQRKHVDLTALPVALLPHFGMESHKKKARRKSLN
jgi:hypothetical protein